jgi:hypothetical protein
MTQNLAARWQISARWRACWQASAGWRACRQAYSDASTLSVCVPSRKIECVRTRLHATESERSGRRVELASELHKNTRGVGYVDDVGSVCSGDDWTEAYSDVSTLNVCVPSRKIECVRTRLHTTESERSGRRVELASELHKNNTRGVGYVDDVGSVCSGDDWTKSEDEEDNAQGSHMVTQFADGHSDDQAMARLVENQPASDRGRDHRRCHGHVYDSSHEKDMALAQGGLEDDGEVVVFYNSKLAKICEQRWQPNLLRARERCE